jgi:hypothetical protein
MLYIFMLYSYNSDVILKIVYMRERQREGEGREMVRDVMSCCYRLFVIQA